MTLEQELERDLKGTIDTAKANGYVPTYFIRMLSEHGAVAAAKKLLQGNDVQSGLFRLHGLGLLHTSVENIALNPKYAALFSKREKDAARARLSELGFEPGEWE